MAEAVTLEMLLEAGDRVVKRLNTPVLEEVSHKQAKALSLVGAAPRGLSAPKSAPRGFGRGMLRRSK